MAIGSDIAALLGDFIGAAGSAFNFSAEQQAAMFNEAQFAKADFSEQRAAVDALLQGAQQGGFARMASAAAASQEQVAYAAAGIDPSKGTAAQVQAYTTRQGDIAAMIDRNNAARAALGHRQTANRYSTQASISAAGRRARETAFGFDAAGQAIKTGGDAANLAMDIAAM